MFDARLRQSGQAASELVAIVPFALAGLLVAAQIALLGYAQWSAGDAARAGARELLVGGDAREAARRAVPSPWRARVRVAGNAVRVEVRSPSLIPGVELPGVASRFALGPAGGGS